jgi:DNA-J related protein/DnaJ domain
MEILANITACVELLLSRHESTAEIDLIKHLQNESIEPFTEFNLRNSRDLFRAHFLLKHCLYKLQDEYLSRRDYCLEISLIKIVRLAYFPGTAKLVTHDSVKAYYLDLSHYFETEEEDVNDMLNNFWARFLAQDDKAGALELLLLPPDASYEEMKSQYRRLAQQEHPDKGGCEERFKKINAARRLLEKAYA